MKRTLVLVLAAMGAAALFAGLVYALLVSARVSESAAITVQGLTLRRLWATSTAVVGLSGVIIGGFALVRRVDSTGTVRAPRGSLLALVAGFIAVVNGALILAVATGGLGSGNGVVGGAVAFVLGVLAVALGGMARSRSRSSTSTGNALN